MGIAQELQDFASKVAAALRRFKVLSPSVSRHQDYEQAAELRRRRCTNLK